MRPVDGQTLGMRHPEGDRLSDELDAQLHEEHVTIGSLADVLDERGFAVVLMLLMIPSALPIPTGGVTHVLEVFGALDRAADGRRPSRAVDPRPARTQGARRDLHRQGGAEDAPLHPLVRAPQRAPASRSCSTPAVVSLLGVVLLVFVVGAFVAPPFSGLDTLPSLGVVVVCLGLVFSDGFIVGAGLVIGVVGLVLEVPLAAALWSFL